MAESLPSTLCADDDADVLEELNEYFTLKGFIILTPSTGIEACLQVKRWGPGSVILDLLIPRLGGLGVLGRIHAIDPALPVVLTTDRGEALATVSDGGLSVAGAFAKPLDLDAIASALARAAVVPPVEPEPSRAAPRVLVVDDMHGLAAAGAGEFRACSSSTSAARASKCERRAAAWKPWSGLRSSTRRSSSSTS